MRSDEQDDPVFRVRFDFDVPFSSGSDLDGQSADKVPAATVNHSANWLMRG